ncbi:zinc finger and BTB domain-containing protein 18.3-like isoform X2 [Physella acuta]|uniref:zinc finger and BTB domain-containing protein 18.3-like isoform X2 n=1 Tax=Physella acuta TaxID=109671 RepID=UPI0027DCD86C|nr:zinc finger and BTB domain-containing protein 18.3-like isoform X2 [Physella acuta]
MPELPVDMAVANRFISSLSKSLQALCHGCMDFDSGIEIVGYININIDSGSKVDYVLNEKVLKSTNNSMTFVSNSFLAKKDQPRPTRDGSCSPILGLSFQGQASPYHSRTWGPHSGSQYQRSSAQFSPHSQVLHGPQKRQWAGDWRASSKKQKSQGSSETYMSQNSAYSHLPSSQSDPTFKHPLLPPLGTETDAASDTENQFINIKKEALDAENEQASTQDPEHSTSEPTDELNSDSTGKLQIKCDPDGSDANETEFPNEAGSSTTDFKGTFLEPSDADQNSSEQNSDPSAPFESDTNESTKKSNIDQSIASTSADDTLAESNLHPDDDEPPVEFEHSNEDMPYPHSVHSDAGEGSSDAGQFEVIEIDDEDEDVQAMFGDPHWHVNKKSVLPVENISPVVPVHFLRTKRTSSTSYLSKDPQLDTGYTSQSDNSLLPYSELSDPDGRLQYRCNLCQEIIRNNALLQRHMNLLHKDAHALPYSCSVCGQGFFSLSGMRLHKHTHFMGRKYQCEVCGYKFLHKHHLKRHEAGVHKMCRCLNCNKLFSSEAYSFHICDS